MLQFNHADLIAAEPFDFANEYWKQYGKRDRYGYLDILERCSLEDFLWCCQFNPKALKIAVGVAIFTAKLVQRKSNDPRLAAPIAAAERCLDEPSEENTTEARATSWAARGAAWGVEDVAWAAADAANAAMATDASWDASCVVAWAAAWVVRMAAVMDAAAQIKAEARRLLLEIE